MKIFGKNPTGSRLQRIEQSPNYRNGQFQNVEQTSVMADVSFVKILKEYFSKPSSVQPQGELPTTKVNLMTLDDAKPVIVWLGHSSYYFSFKGFRMLVDPVLSGNASPFSGIGKAFKGSDVYSVEDFPQLDVLLITHDHYDHLDYKTVLKLMPGVKRIITALGVGSHLEYWGIESKKITELDWWEIVNINSEIKLSASPSRHFSGRLFKRAKTLWASFVLEIYDQKIYLGGDSGYGKHFKMIGEKYSGFDLAILDSGQYGKGWPLIHMIPEETVQAGKDLNASVVLPVHWSKFVLSVHPWNEPIKRFVRAAEQAEFKTVTPMIGQPLWYQESAAIPAWWEYEK
ncbi:MAG: MBL fold metallo-hydrolase [Bacteroidetes bacterium]|nr:MBL fold metallo-hydrolase [Bacteroidota bacterium]